MIAPATAGPDGLAFPITGAAVNARTLAGRITHSGGITLTKGSTQVALSDFILRINRHPDLTAKLNGGTRASILNLSQAKVKIRGRTVTITPVGATLTDGAAQALNQAFATTAFQTGLKLGTATVKAKLK